jgi:hypothetical protein
VANWPATTILSTNGRIDYQVAGMKNGNLPGLSPLWLISLALVLGTLIVVALPMSIASGDNIKSSDWIGFAGNVVAGAITLLAAIIAWFAVQRQITAQESAEKRGTQRAAEQRDAEMSNAKEAAKIVLTHTVHAAAAVTNVTEQYLEPRSAEPPFPGLQTYYTPGKALAAIKPKLDKVMAQLRSTMSHFAIAEAWKDLGIDDKSSYLMVTATLHTVTNVYDNPPPIPFDELINNQHHALSQLSVYLRRFDDELADVYDRDSKV